MTFFRLLLILSSLVTIFSNNLSLLNIVLLLIGTIFSVYFTYKFVFSQNISGYILFFLFWCPTVFLPGFHLVKSGIALSVEVTPEWNNKILEFSIPIYLFVSILLVITGRIRNHPNSTINYKPILISYTTLKLFLIGCIFLSIFCYSIGLGRMGHEAVVLPFGLGGLINLFRSIVVPIVFALIIEGYLMEKRKIPRIVWVYYSIWIFVEIIAWLSKGVIISRLLPSLLVLYIYYRPSLKRMTLFLIPIVIAFLSMYPVIAAMRYIDSDTSLMESVMQAREESNNNKEESSIGIVALNRVFLFPAQYAQDYNFINRSSLFDFSKAPSIMAMGGAHRYQTFVIDGYPPNVFHSSGTNGILDPLLHGGIGLLLITITLLVYLSHIADYLLNKRKYLTSIIVIFIIRDFTLNANITSFYDITCIETFILYFICIILANKLNYRKA